MSDWTDGYVDNIPYTYGYFSELSPLRIKLALLSAGLAAPEISNACELGFGQGMSANLNATASGTNWFGTDFTPSHAAFAQELATAAGTAANLRDDSFAEYCARTDLPDFDFIGLHGIWSWINDENRAVITDFARRKLKPGGVLYVSYNTAAGWASFSPVRDLLAQHVNHIGAPGTDISQRLNEALDFASRLFATNPLYARANPQAAKRLEKLSTQDRNYLVHEYLNRDWQPMPFSSVQESLAPAKLSYACSAVMLDHFDALNLTSVQQTMLREVPDQTLRETVRDLMTNTQFRRDYWLKGARRIGALERIDSLRAMHFVLVANRNDVLLKAKGALGEGNLHENVHAPILDCLADHKPRTLAQIAQLVKEKDVAFPQALQATLTLVGTGYLAVAQDEQSIQKARTATGKLNQHLLQRARHSGESTFLASPVTGGGIRVGRAEQLFLLARSLGHKLPSDWAAFAQQTLTAQKQGIQKDGKPLTTPKAIIAEFTVQANDFIKKRLPLLEALQIA